MTTALAIQRDHIRIRTAVLEIRVQKEPFPVAMYDLEGNLISKDTGVRGVKKEEGTRNAGGTGYDVLFRQVSKLRAGQSDSPRFCYVWICAGFGRLGRIFAIGKMQKSLL